MVSQAMDQAAIRASQRHRKVSDYLLGTRDRRRARLSGLAGDPRPPAGHQAPRAALSRPDGIVQRGPARSSSARPCANFSSWRPSSIRAILRIYGFSEHELGPALIFEHDPLSIRLDHFLAQRRERLSVDTRLDLLRQIAEVVRFAHDKKVVHRGLCPQSILVTDASTPHPRIKIFNWQVGYREGSSTSKVSQAVAATSHVDRLVEDATTAYMAPEAIADETSLGEHLDVFSLGAIAYHLFSGEPPAANGLELSNKLRETKGLADQRGHERRRPRAFRTWSSSPRIPKSPAASTRPPISWNCSIRSRTS